MSNKVTITITGPEHSGKTNIAILISRYLEQLGANVSQQIDPQLDVKKNKTIDELAHRIQDIHIQLMEQQTFK